MYLTGIPVAIMFIIAAFLIYIVPHHRPLSVYCIKLVVILNCYFIILLLNYETQFATWWSIKQ